MFEGIKAKMYNWAFKEQLGEWDLKKHMDVQADSSLIQMQLDRQPVWTKWTTKAAVDEGYKLNLWVFAAINKKAKAAASVPWYVYKRTSSGSWERLEKHPLQTLIDQPNPFNSRNNMIERLIMQLDLAGNSLFHIVDVGGVPVELWNIGPDGIKPIPDPQKFIKEYEYTFEGSARKVQIETSKMLHFMYINPGNPYWGISPLQVAAKTVDTDVEAINWNKISLQNRAVTDGAFSVEKNLTTEQYTELRRQIREQHQGSQNARAPWVLSGGAQWNQMSLSPVDMDFISGRQMTREEICAAFQVPPPLVGILDKANYSNMKEARRVFWLDTIIPLLDDLKESFNRGLTHYFGDDIMLDYDTSAVEALAENINEKIEAANKLFSMGIPFNAINERLDLGFDEVPGGDIGYLSGSMMPASMARALAAGATDPQPTDDPNADPQAGETLGKSKARQLKAYNLQTGEQKAEYWKAFERQRSSWYARMQKGALDLFKEEGDAVAAAYKNSGGDLDKTLEAVDLERWKAFYVTYYRAIIEDFGTDTFEGFKSIMPQQRKEWNPWNQTILNYIFRAAADKVTKVTDYTKQLVKGIIYTGRDDGNTINTIARDLAKGFDEFSINRAFTIARTETVAASNYGSYIAAEQASEEVGDLIKEWVDSGDNRVRDSHEDVNGEEVPFYTKFSNGLLYPGDMENGAAKDVIKCRCTVIYHPAAYR